MGENRAAVSVAVFSRFAIYANVVRCATFYTSGDAAIARLWHLLCNRSDSTSAKTGYAGALGQSANDATVRAGQARAIHHVHRAASRQHAKASVSIAIQM